MLRFSHNLFAPHDELQLVLALAKGKLLNTSLQWLTSAGLSFTPADAGSRRLILSSQTGDLHALLVKPQDVPIYVEYGIADMGIAGKDVLMESEADVFEPCDLGFGQCKVVVAGRAEDSI